MIFTLYAAIMKKDKNCRGKAVFIIFCISEGGNCLELMLFRIDTEGTDSAFLSHQLAWFKE